MHLQGAVIVRVIHNLPIGHGIVFGTPSYTKVARSMLHSMTYALMGREDSGLMVSYRDLKPGTCRYNRNLVVLIASTIF